MEDKALPTLLLCILTLLLANGSVWGRRVWFVSSGIGSFQNESSSSLATYSFNVSGRLADGDAGRGFIGRVRAEADKGNLSIAYALKDSADQSPIQLLVDSVTGDLQIRPAHLSTAGTQQLTSPTSASASAAATDSVHFFVTAEERTSAPAAAGSHRLITSSDGADKKDKVVAKVTLIFSGNDTGMDGLSPVFDLAVPSTALVGDVIGRVELASSGRGITYSVSSIDVLSKDSPGANSTATRGPSGRLLDITARSGEVYVSMFLAAFSQQRLQLTVAASEAAGQRKAQGSVRVWIYDCGQEVQLSLGLPVSALLQHGYSNLTQQLSAGFGWPLALGRVSLNEAVTPDSKRERTIVKLIFLDKTRNHIISPSAVLTELDRNSASFRGLERALALEKMQVSARSLPAWENVSLAAIVLIAVCAFLALCLCLVTGIFCHLKRRYRHGYFYSRQRIPTPPTSSGKLPAYRAKGSLSASSMHSLHPISDHPSFQPPASGHYGNALHNHGWASSRTPSLSSTGIGAASMTPAPYIYGSIGNPLASFRNYPVDIGPKPERGRMSSYEEQEMSLSLASDAISCSGRRSEEVPKRRTAVDAAEMETDGDVDCLPATESDPLSRITRSTAKTRPRSQTASQSPESQLQRHHRAAATTGHASSIHAPDTPTSLEQTYF
ncbi:uncharacterized protein LOC129593358 isoform X2 [Paramacrobiotus metropolitanus]|uniref:uncharacterized protein LOC129593358 isoform X2 n=1 Tax=Paramacrobiotus metropolitanus TaxID=2943436 RepID=UPI0024462D41|nr:uncharacterized protein LOC129593358 isoform X2 [Paramacrobiotus metropolitanus]